MAFDTHDEWWRHPFDDRWTLASLLDQAATQHAERPALVSSDAQQFTHAEIADAAARLSTAIQSACPPESVVACLTTLDLSSFVAVRGAMTSGRVFAALDAAAPDRRNQASLDGCSAEVIVTNAACAAQAERLAGKRRQVIVIEETNRLPPAPVAQVYPTSTAALVFTSGTTGVPKAVVRTHRDLAHAAYCISKTLCRYTAEDRMLVPGTPGHVGSLNDILCALLGGFMVVPMDISLVSLPRLLELYEQHRMNVLGMPPSLLRALLPLLADSTAPPPRLVVTSGEALLRTDVRAFFKAFPKQVELWQNYGSTETGPVIAARYTRDDADGRGPLPLRAPHEHCQIEIVTSDGQVAPVGGAGRVRVRSPYLAAGYLNADEHDVRAFETIDGERVFWTGDVGHFASGGELFLSGRSGRQFSQHGRRFEAGEVEAAALDCPDVSEAALVQVPGRPGNAFELVVTARLGGKVDVEQLRATLRTLLLPAAVPGRITVAEAMPRTASGKLDYRAVERMVLGRGAGQPMGTGGAPVGRLENWIADCWQEVLGIARPGRDEPFDTLGGDSLAAIQLSWLLESRLGVYLPPDRLAEATTIAAQAQAGDPAAAPHRSVTVTLRNDAAGPVVVLLPGAGGHAWVFAELCRRLETAGSYLGVSYPALMEQLPQQPGRTEIAAALASTVAAQAAEQRPLVIVGYSLGGLMATDVVRRLDTDQIPVAATLLIDPAGVAGDRSQSAARREMRRLRDLFRRSAQPGPAAPQTRFEREMASVFQSLAAAYRDAKIEIPDHSTRVLLSSKMKAHFRAHPPESPTFDVAACDELACGHLDLLRIPHVHDTARWLEVQLSQLKLATPAPTPQT